MQQTTIFSMLMILVNKRKVSREYLAARFSVSVRTVSRYIAVLQDAGVPVTYSPGRGGGYILDDGYTVDKTFLTEAETIRLKDALRLTEEEFDDRVNRALSEKLDAVGKSREHDRFAVNQDGLYIDCDYEQSEILRPRIKLFSQAIEQNRAVEIKYADARGYVSYRTVDPYTLVFKEGAWYIYALCRLRGEFRLFKLTRIRDCRKTSKRFVKLDSHLIEKLELEYYNEVYVNIEFELFPSVEESVADWLGQSAITEKGTKLVASAEVPLTDALIKRLLSYGSSIRVTEPPELAEQLRDEAKRMISLYGDE